MLSDCSHKAHVAIQGALLNFVIFDVDVRCADREMARFAPPAGQTCQEYLAPFMQTMTGYIENPVCSLR